MSRRKRELIKTDMEILHSMAVYSMRYLHSMKNEQNKKIVSSEQRKIREGYNSINRLLTKKIVKNSKNMYSIFN